MIFAAFENEVHVFFQRLKITRNENFNPSVAFKLKI